MKFFATAVSVVTLAGSAFAQLTINSPVLVQCQPAQLQFSGGTAPYYLTVLPGGQPTATPLLNLGEQQTSPWTWAAVNIASGTSITLGVRDSTGAVQYSSPLTIQAGTSNACLNEAVSGTSAGSTIAVASSAAASVSSASASAASSAAAAVTTTGAAGSSLSSSAASVASSLSSALSSAKTTEAAATSAMSMSMSMSMAMSSAKPSTTAAAGGSSSAAAASSSAPATSSKAGAMPTGIVGSGAIVLGAIGAVAAML